nr:hypothetical protein GCM10020092_088860 [Actinoplanes digitatis]
MAERDQRRQLARVRHRLEGAVGVRQHERVVDVCQLAVLDAVDVARPRRLVADALEVAGQDGRLGTALQCERARGGHEHRERGCGQLSSHGGTSLSGAGDAVGDDIERLNIKKIN